MRPGYDPNETIELLKEISSINYANFKNGAHIAHVIAYRLGRNADPDARDKNGETLLHQAASGGRTEIVGLLLKNGANPNVVNYGITPLHHAAGCGHTAIVKLLLEKGAIADVATQDGATPLQLAVSGGYTEISKLLLEKRAKADVADQSGTTPLHLAILEGYTEIAELLLENGVDPNFIDQRGSTLLFYAIAKCRTEITKLFLEKGADPNLANRKGETLFHYALLAGYTEIVKLLLEKGANPFMDFPNPDIIPIFEYLPKIQTRFAQLQPEQQNIFLQVVALLSISGAIQISEGDDIAIQVMSRPDVVAQARPITVPAELHDKIKFINQVTSDVRNCYPKETANPEAQSRILNFMQGNFAYDLPADQFPTTINAIRSAIAHHAVTHRDADFLMAALSNTSPKAAFSIVEGGLLDLCSTERLAKALLLTPKHRVAKLSTSGQELEAMIQSMEQELREIPELRTSEIELFMLNASVDDPRVAELVRQRVSKHWIVEGGVDSMQKSAEIYLTIKNVLDADKDVKPVIKTAPALGSGGEVIAADLPDKLKKLIAITAGEFERRGTEAKQPSPPSQAPVVAGVAASLLAPKLVKPQR